MNWRLIWKSLADSDMRKRILVVLGIIVVFRLLAHVPIPLSNPETLRQVLQNLFAAQDTPQFLNFVNTLSGGALANFSIMLVGLGPYINSSIIMQLLTKAIPKLEEMNKEGEFGRKKINQYTRMLTLPLAVIQSVGTIFLVKQQASSIAGLGDITAGSSLLQWVLMISALTGGAMMLMWLGELITEQNIGNGISILITVGIIASLPTTIIALVQSVFSGGTAYNILGLSFTVDKNGLIFVSILTLVILLVTAAVVKLNEAQRRLTVHYAKRVQGNRAYGGVTTMLPVKMITAGVIPIIFAVAFLSVPSFAGQLLLNHSNPTIANFAANLNEWFQTPTATTLTSGEFSAYIYPLVYFFLVFLFTFFYTSIAFNAKDIAENLQKQGGFLEDIRSGEQTEKYLSYVVNRLTLFGAVSLGALAVVPIIGEAFYGNNLAIAGTSILILVSVSLETLRQVESRAMLITYSQYDGSDFFQTVEKEDKKRRIIPGIPKKLKRNKKAKK